MFNWLGRLVTRYAPGIVIVILLISIFFAFTIPRLEFKTNLNTFLPDNELSEANNYINDHFGHDYDVHLILIEADNAAKDILTPDALREQYRLYEISKDKANVEGVLSIVSVLDEVFTRIYPDNYSGFDDLTDTQINEAKELLFNILSGSLDISYLNFYLDLEPGITLEDLQQMVDLFFDKSFDYNEPEPKVRRTIMIIYFDSNLDDNIIDDISLNLVDTVTIENPSNSPITIKHTSAALINAKRHRCRCKTCRT